MSAKITSILFLLCVFAAAAAAHPLGNFSVNNFARIEVEENQISLQCVLDMAEIPTFQESQKIDVNKNGTLEKEELDAYLTEITPQIVGNYDLSVDDVPLQIQTISKNISLPVGAGNLSTLRMEWSLMAPLPAGDKESVHRLRFEDNNYKGRVGWNEIVVKRASHINIFDSTAYGSTLTDGLKTYPEDMLAAPLTEREAEFSFTAAAVPADAKLLGDRNGSISAPVQKDKFAELISVPEITPAIALFGLLLAFGFGAIHAMSPGHGKTVVGAYLVGSRGTLKHAIFLGLTVTITHTIGVFAIGLVTLFASNYILPEKLMPFLSFVSGLLVFYIGITLFKDRALVLMGWKTPYEQDHSHADNIDGLHDDYENHTHADGLTHTHGGSTHTHLPPENITWKSLLTLGISGGLLPCPSALVLMLAAISGGRVGYGLILTIAFSFGLAATLTGIGLVFLYVGKAFGGSKLAGNRIFKMLPVFSAFVIACVGAVICYTSLI
jgi:nickel/cobalt exporter